MNIQLHEIAVRNLVAGYEDRGDEGIVGYGGKLDIRPAYQREFIYKDKQREAVVDSVMNGFPLNVMYWARREDGSFEVMDGQPGRELGEGDVPGDPRADEEGAVGAALQQVRGSAAGTEGARSARGETRRRQRRAEEERHLGVRA